MPPPRESVRVTFDGQAMETTRGGSLLQAWVESGRALIDNVGCMGQGVCGACRVLVRRAASDEVVTALACETPAEEGMQVAAIDYFSAHRPHAYDLHALPADAAGETLVDAVFPEAKHCRHCSGCDRACPRGIEVQAMVNDAAAGSIAAAAERFDHCVMCNLCVAACPEDIDPAHLGQFVRRLQAAQSPIPGDLDARLRDIEAGGQTIRWPQPTEPETP